MSLYNDLTDVLTPYANKIKEVNESLDAFIVKSPKNLINKNTIIEGYTLNYADGTVSENAGRCVTDYLPVKKDVLYNKNHIGQWAIYDANKTYLGWQQPIDGTPVVVSSIFENAAYIRTSFAKENASIVIFCEDKYYDASGVSGEGYESYTDTADVLFLSELKRLKEVGDGEIIEGENLFDYRTSAFMGIRINENTGAAVIYNNFDTSGNVIGTNAYIGLFEYFPLIYGESLYCNYEMWGVAFYGSSKEYIGKESATQAVLNGVVAPEGCYFARVNIKGSETPTTGRISNLNDVKNIVLWKKTTDQKMMPVPTRRRAFEIDGSMVANNYLDKVIPTMMESEFLSAMRCMAIREINRRDHAWRFGNFNMWIMANVYGWDMTRKMLMDYGIDFCGFEECVTAFSTSKIDFAKYIQSWQFPHGFYTNLTDGEDSIDKSFVSRFDVLSSTKLHFTSTSSNASYLNCKVSLPRYMDVYNPYRTLSVYIVHFAITTSETKIAIAKELLTKVATDTSDFVVILGDTNDFGTTDETKDYWVTLEAGGFRPVIPLTTKTVTQDSLEVVEGDSTQNWRKHALDQFLISDNIDIVSYGVVNTKDEYAVSTITGSGTDNEPALSDHDFVYCDLKFNYDRARSAVVIPE